MSPQLNFFLYKKKSGLEQNVRCWKKLEVLASDVSIEET